MKKPKWYAKALYIAFALALAIGMTPLVASAGEASIVIQGPCHGKAGEPVTFIARCNTPADNVEWWFGDPNAPPDPPDTTSMCDSPVTHTYAAENMYTVIAIGHWGTVTQETRHDIVIGVGLIPQEEYNIIGTNATFRVPAAYNGHVLCWAFNPSAELNGSWNREPGTGRPACPDDTPYPGDNKVTVRGTDQGELLITAYTEAFTGPPPDYIEYPATHLDAIKKWGKIDDTWLWGCDWETKECSCTSGSTQVWWNENDKKWEGKAELIDLVIGTYVTDGIGEFHHLANGADVEWWVMDARAPVHELPSGIPACWSEMYGPGLVELIEDMQDDYPSMLVGFNCDCDQKYAQTVSGDYVDPSTGKPVPGATGVTLCTCGEEAVKIVVVAKYPEGLHCSEWPVFPEILSWNFWTQEVEKVPQVHWAGEKKVLEKQFGSNYAGNLVSFKLDQGSVGLLEGVNPTAWPDLQDTVWDCLDANGTARVMIHTQDYGQYDVTATLWDCKCKYDDASYLENSTNNCTKIINQHDFFGYFLKVEEITLGNVNGTREDHNAGLWTPPNPFCTSTDMLTETLNVSEDTLLRVRVKGFFEMKDKSIRDESWCDVNGNGVKDMYDYILPAGRWVLPDDWQYLAGPEWQQNRPHWDIMDQPNDDVVGLTPLGDYIDASGALIAEAPVIGPISGLDTYTPTIDHPGKLDRKTIVRNGKLNWWDCPMPPAKILFKIQDSFVDPSEIAGFFKDADKAEIYYLPDDPIVWTNPYYETNIPGNALIPPFTNDCGYDWDSWNWTANYGPYPFWKIINQPPGQTPDDDQHPTKVEVYSDNHGEAMVYLNGDWNLDWAGLWQDWGTIGIDIPPGTEVANTTVKAGVDYPYCRGKHPKVLSNNVTKTWTWGKEVRGADDHEYKDHSWDPFDSRIVYDVVGTNNLTKVAYIFVCDRDGFPAVDEKIEWELRSADNMGTIMDVTGRFDLGGGLAVNMTNGFLEDTDGYITDGTDQHGVSWTRLPGADELAVWADKYGMEPCHHAVAAVTITSSEWDLGDLSIYLDEGPQIGTIKRTADIMFGEAEDFVTTPGDSNQDGEVNMGDVTKTERIILDLDAPTSGADANQDGNINMGDVTKTEIIILGA